MDPRDPAEELELMGDRPLADRAAALEEIERTLRAELDALVGDEPGE